LLPIHRLPALKSHGSCGDVVTIVTFGVNVNYGYIYFSAILQTQDAKKPLNGGLWLATEIFMNPVLCDGYVMKFTCAIGRKNSAQDLGNKKPAEAGFVFVIFILFVKLLYFLELEMS